MSNIGLQSLANAPIIIDNNCPDNLAALVGTKRSVTSTLFSRELSLMDLETGNITGNCRTIVNIRVNEKGKTKLLKLIGSAE